MSLLKTKKIIRISDPKIQKQILSFPAQYRMRMAKFAQQHPAFADMVLSFPALAFALATRYGGDEDCYVAKEFIKEGASMIKVADIYGIPRWLRKLPPEAFTRPLPLFPCNPKFNLNIANLVPKNAEVAVVWFDWVMTGLDIEGTEFVLWLAKQKMFSNATPQETLLHLPSVKIIKPLALYFWHSHNKYILPKPVKYWNKKMTVYGAANQCKHWLGNISSSLRITNSWITQQNVMGYEFVPLMNQAELSEEGSIMDHCVSSYFDDLLTNRSRIFSIRLQEDHVATIEVCPKYRHPEQVEIEEFQGPGNSRVSDRIYRAAQHWLTAFNERRDAAPIKTGRQVYKKSPWLKLWFPYMQVRQKNPDFFEEFDDNMSAIGIYYRH